MMYKYPLIFWKNVTFTIKIKKKHNQATSYHEMHSWPIERYSINLSPLSRDLALNIIQQTVATGSAQRADWTYPAVALGRRVCTYDGSCVSCHGK